MRLVDRRCRLIVAENGLPPGFHRRPMLTYFDNKEDRIVLEENTSGSASN